MVRLVALSAFGLIALLLAAGQDPPSGEASTLAGIGRVGGGAAHTCAVTTAGGAKCWGLNDVGQLGDGTFIERNKPVNVSGLTSGVDSIAVGLSHACALTTAGAVRCWGRNASGQLGDGTATTRNVPVTVSDLGGGVAAITAGWAHTCALLLEGGVKCWGDNTFGELGAPCAEVCTAPVDVTLPDGAAAIAANGYFTCALTTPGGVKCWGDNTFGQVGDGTTEDRDGPVDVTGLASGVAAIGLGGGGHACAITEAGPVKCWGNNEFGQLGENRGCRTPCVTPSDVQNLPGALAITGGYFFTCAITPSGAVKCWGGNDFGQLGDGGACGLLCGKPLDVIGLSSGFESIGAGSRHVCAGKADGSVFCWGDNFNGQVGDNGECGTRCFTPVEARGLGAGGATGDGNCDGATNAIDAALILQVSAGFLSSLPCGDDADANGDGRLTAIDAALILQLVAGLIDRLPAS